MKPELNMTVEEVKELLRLQPHFEGGWYARTYESYMRLPQEVLGGVYPGPRLAGTAIYYLLEPGCFSEIHRLRSDEIFHFYMGDAVEMLQLLPAEDGMPAASAKIGIGLDLMHGERPQVLARSGVWQGSRLKPGGRWALLGCTVAPGFEFEDYEKGSRAELFAQWPEHAEMIRGLTR